MLVYDLNHDELGELKEELYWEYVYEEIGVPWDLPHDIPDEVVFEKFDGICFTKDDFFCNLSKGE